MSAKYTACRVSTLCTACKMPTRHTACRVSTLCTASKMCSSLQGSAKAVAAYCLQTCKPVPSIILVVHTICKVQSAKSSLSCFPSVHDCSLAVYQYGICESAGGCILSYSVRACRPLMSHNVFGPKCVMPDPCTG